MKKITLVFSIILALAFVSARDVSSQTNLAWNIGAITDKSFKFDPFLWTNGFTLDLYLSPRLSLSPEIFMVLHNFEFGAFILAPAVLLNIQTESFFLGGGVTKWWALGTEVSGAPSSDVMCKLNFGLVGHDVKLTVFAVTPFQDFFRDTWLGATFGIYF